MIERSTMSAFAFKDSSRLRCPVPVPSCGQVPKRDCHTLPAFRHSSSPRVAVDAKHFCRTQYRKLKGTALRRSAARAVSGPSVGLVQDSSPQRRRAFAWLACAALAIAFLSFFPAGTALAGQASTASSGGFSLSNALKGLVNIALHLDKHLGKVIATHHQRTYYILFAIVFAETGFVLTPFLPGDSLLFAAGAFATPGSPLRFSVVLATFIAAAILGDAVNYAIGSFVGQQAMSSKLIKQEYIHKTEAFYSKYGGKTLVLARFVPIIRTFAPFIAGVAKMSYGKFAAFNVAGALLWTILFTGAGYSFGNLPFVKHNFTLVILAIVLVSIVPVLLELVNERNRLRVAARDSPASPAAEPGTSLP